MPGTQHADVLGFEKDFNQATAIGDTSVASASRCPDLALTGCVFWKAQELKPGKAHALMKCMRSAAVACTHRQGKFCTMLRSLPQFLEVSARPVPEPNMQRPRGTRACSCGRLLPVAAHVAGKRLDRVSASPQITLAATVFLPSVKINERIQA